MDWSNVCWFQLYILVVIVVKLIKFHIHILILGDAHFVNNLQINKNNGLILSDCDLYVIFCVFGGH